MHTAACGHAPCAITLRSMRMIAREAARQSARAVCVHPSPAQHCHEASTHTQKALPFVNKRKTRSHVWHGGVAFSAHAGTRALQSCRQKCACTCVCQMALSAVAAHVRVAARRVRRTHCRARPARGRS
eukprot:1607502-Prymnesium_polylepis.1